MSEHDASIFEKAKEKLSGIAHSAEKFLISMQECGPLGHNDDVSTYAVDEANTENRVSGMTKISTELHGVEVPKEGQRLDVDKDKEVYMKYRNENPLEPHD
uniref:Uncharacterized protein n=1 Tax=Acrobeloides nanus TaxID=290746 RepID=A0A914E541_9BILA